MALFSVTLGDPKPPHFYCTTACNVMHGIAVTILSVRPSVRNFCHIVTYDYTVSKKFLPLNSIGNFVKP